MLLLRWMLSGRHVSSLLLSYNIKYHLYLHLFAKNCQAISMWERNIKAAPNTKKEYTDTFPEALRA
ncbi:MAG: hypothetical protein NVS4B12_15120 [Ktedonobacteraceae bacterium]